MELAHQQHLAYCTNIHRGQSWEETFASLQQYTLAVRDQVAGGQPYAIGLRLSAQAAASLIQPETLSVFRAWLDQENCYVFTINGFPYGQFHGTRVKEQVYAPDWTSPDRLAFTNLLFDILAQIVPEGVEGSVSTVPCSFKEFITDPGQVRQMRAHLWQCVEHVAQLSQRHRRALHLGLEPEPLCFLETSLETVEFIDQMRQDRSGDERLGLHLGVNYDTCHLAVEFEEPGEVIRRFQDAGVKISKIHLSSALKVRPGPETLQALRAFVDDTYFHQVIARSREGALTRYRDLDLALDQAAHPPSSAVNPRDLEEWRIHFHIPLHCEPTEVFGNTADHILGVLGLLREQPSLCRHLEMETYTWEVMPHALRPRSVVDQLVAEYHWTLRHYFERA